MILTVQRRSIEETWHLLEKESEVGEVPRDAEGRPFIPSQIPSYDDEELGFSFFRSIVEDADYSNLTLPRTFFGRSGFERTSFQNTDLSESRMCWNDFIECDFSTTDLTACDMRASTYIRCKFDQADMKNADLRHSTFEECTFVGAKVEGAIVDVPSANECELFKALNDEQLASLERREEPSSEPDGG